MLLTVYAEVWVDGTIYFRFGSSHFNAAKANAMTGVYQQINMAVFAVEYCQMGISESPAPWGRELLLSITNNQTDQYNAITLYVKQRESDSWMYGLH